MKIALEMALLLTMSALVACSAPLERFEYARDAMGTSFRIVLYAPDGWTAHDAATAAFARIDELDARLSDWRDDSELAAGARAAAQAPSPPIAISDDLLRVLTRAQQVASASDGAFDVTVGPLVKLWRRSRRQGALPSTDALTASRAATGFRHLELDRARQTMRLLVPGMQLDLGGIAKGDALDVALALLRERGLDRALIVGGGDVVAGEPPPGCHGWTIGLAELRPDETMDEATDKTKAAALPPPGSAVHVAYAVELSNAALSTSGDSSRFVVIDGQRYSHIIDPRTGLGLTRRILASVIARDGATADALATAVNILGPERGLELVEQFPGASARVETLDAGRVQACTSTGWPPMMPAPADDP